MKVCSNENIILVETSHIIIAPNTSVVMVPDVLVGFSDVR